MIEESTCAVGGHPRDCRCQGRSAHEDVDPKALAIAKMCAYNSTQSSQIARAITALLRERDEFAAQERQVADAQIKRAEEAEAKLREREERDQKDMDDLDDVARHREGHPKEDMPELGCFVCRLIERSVREREEEIGRLRAQITAFVEGERLWAEEFDKDDDPHTANLRIATTKLLAAEAALAKKDEALRRIELSEDSARELQVIAREARGE